MFGASTPQIAMLPLVAVLVMTGLKDGLEDWRRARLDNEVNNSAATKLGSWKNVNQPTDPRNWLERKLGLGNGQWGQDAAEVDEAHVVCAAQTRRLRPRACKSSERPKPRRAWRSSSIARLSRTSLLPSSSLRP